MATAFRYKPHFSDQEAHYAGVPRRDLTQEEFDGLSDDQKAAVLTGVLYEPVTAPARASVREAKADKPKEAAGEAGNPRPA